MEMIDGFTRGWTAFEAGRLSEGIGGTVFLRKDGGAGEAAGHCGGGQVVSSAGSGPESDIAKEP